MNFYFLVSHDFAALATTQGLGAAYAAVVAQGSWADEQLVTTAKWTPADPDTSVLEVKTTGEDSDWDRFHCFATDGPHNFPHYDVPVPMLVARAESVTIVA